MTKTAICHRQIEVNMHREVGDFVKILFIFLDVFAKLRKANIGFNHVCLSVRPHGTTGLPLEGFS